ncbi:hypothetical protein LZC95_27790 [Pendulispora brunnea]|uniref:Uncharacterized protein n=1 Tax=Pendulispora brunnea TaxID=2905690 RepID=A0ABZ2JV87_9BACT
MALKNLFGHPSNGPFKRALTLVVSASLIAATTSLPVHAEDASEAAELSEAADSSAQADENWHRVSTTARTHTPVAAAILRGREWFFLRGNDDNHIWYSSDGQNFNQHPHGGATDAAPAAVVFHDTLYVFHVGQGGDLWYSTLTPGPGSGFSEWHRVPGSEGLHLRTTEPPTVTASARALYVLGMRNDEHIVFARTNDGTHWSNFDEPTGNAAGPRTLSAVGATAATDGSGTDWLVVAHRGTNNGVYWSGRRESDGFWLPWTEQNPGARTLSQPSLESFYGDDRHAYIGASIEGIDHRVWARSWDFSTGQNHGWRHVDDGSNVVTTDVAPTLIWLARAAVLLLAVSQNGIIFQKQFGGVQ